MIRDRMPDLCATRRSGSFGRGFLQDVHIHMSQNKKLSKVLEEVEEIRSLIQLIVENISIIKDLHNNVLTHNNREIQGELESRTFTVSQTSFRVRAMLKDMGKEISAIDDLTVESAREGPAYARIRVLQYTTMTRLFSEVMQEYNESLMKYHDKCSSLLQRQGTLTRKDITSVELDEMMNTQERNLFVDNILEDSRLVKQQLSDIQSRHNDIIKLEKSLIEVRDMFTEMAFLVEKQGDQLNCVEYFAGKATHNIDGGRNEIHRAEKKSHKWRKRKIKFIIIIVTIIVILLLIAIFF
ncbi:syntaxin-1B isoform X1 [Cephus cinctus]|uniref:Syntaxin-1B isoform X1 n=1 Tax=Cephus cinctus TaxID=211228 RepID=A0AAJ7C5B4_CEPCN|nr:syntaxin-1B isoform X1 [Cephus cinctus]